jgi:hypothetical protein
MTHANTWPTLVPAEASHHMADHGTAPCPACLHPGPLRRHAVRLSWWRDVPDAGQPQIKRGHIVRWRCPACCQTHSCPPAWALPGKRITRALHAWVQQARQSGLGNGAIANLCGLDEKTIRDMPG